MMEAPYELPEGWTWCSLEDVLVDFQPGFACGARDERGCIQLRMNNIGLNGKVVLEKTLKVPSEKTNFEKYDLRYGDILFNNTNSVELIGKTAMFRNEIDSCTFSNHITRIRPDNRLISSEFLLNFLVNEYYKGVFQMMCHRFVGQAGISREKVLKHVISLPPLNEQYRIVAKLEALLSQVNASKEHLTKVPPHIKQFRQSVLAAACSGELTKNWRKEHADVEPASELLNRIQEERIRRYEEECRNAVAEGKRKPKKPINLELEKVDTDGLPELPEGWVWTSLFNLSFLITKGATPTSYGFNYEDEGINFIKVENIVNSYINFNTLHHITKEAHEFLKRSQLQGYDILFSIAGTIGRSAIVREHLLPANTNQALAIIRLPYDLIAVDYILLSLKDHTTILNTQNEMRGVGMNNISLNDVNNIIIPLPPLEEQYVIVERTDKLFQFADEVEQRYHKVQVHVDKLTQSILAKAFRGELVPQDPNDEPASLLLERIKKERVKNEKEKKEQKRKSKTLLDYC